MRADNCGTCLDVDGSPCRLRVCLSSVEEGSACPCAVCTAPGGALLFASFAGLSSPVRVRRTVPGNFRPLRKLHRHMNSSSENSRELLVSAAAMFVTAVEPFNHCKTDHPSPVLEHVNLPSAYAPVHLVLISSSLQGLADSFLRHLDLTAQQ